MSTDSARQMDAHNAHVIDYYLYLCDRYKKLGWPEKAEWAYTVACELRFS